METISTKLLLMVPASNMRAVTSEGETILPDPAAKTRPNEDVIMNVTDADRFVYHYTSLDTAKKIVSGLSLRMGEFHGTNDPKESKEWHFDLFSRTQTDFRGIDAAKLSRDLSEAIKTHARVLCFCRDSAGLTGNHMADVSLRGHFKARMWAQYGSSHKDSSCRNQSGNHSGVCFVFDRKKLTESIKRECGGFALLQFVNIIYRNRHVVPGPEEQDYFVDCDVLRMAGFDNYWKWHALRYRQRLFFEKSLDWRDECEFRVLAMLKKPREVFVSIEDSLCGLFLGEKCDSEQARGIVDVLMDRGVHVMGLSWKNCTPWYDFGNPAYNFSARALDAAVKRHDANRSSQDHVPEKGP